MEDSDILDERVGLLIDESMLPSSSSKGSDLICSDSASYEKFILDLDSYWDELNDRLSVSRMVSDSVVKGIVNAISEEAKEKIASKEAVIAVLKKKLQSSNPDASLVQNLGPLVTLKKSFVAEPESNGTLESNTCCLNARGNCNIADKVSRLKIMTEDQFQRLKKDLEHLKSSRIMSREDIACCNISHEERTIIKVQEIDQRVDNFRDMLLVEFEQIGAIMDSQKARLSELQFEYELQREVTSVVLQDYFRSLEDEYETKLYKKSVFINTLNKNWQEKASELGALRDELHAISEELNNHDNFEEWSVAKRKEHFPSKVLGNHKFSSQPEENAALMMEKLGDSGEHMLDIADLSQLKHMSKEELLAYCKTEMTNMRRKHDSALQEKTEELFKLKRQFLKEKGSLPFRKDKEVEHLRKKLPEFVSKLNEILTEKEIIPPTSSHDDELQSFKARMDLLYSENKRLRSSLIKKANELKYLSAQISDAEDQMSFHSSIEADHLREIRKLECDIEDIKAEADLRDALCNIVLRGMIDDHNHTMQNTEIEIKIMLEISTDIFRGVICNAIASMNPAISKYYEESISLKALVLEKEKALRSIIKENQKLQQVAVSISSSVKEKEKLALVAGSTLMQQKQQLDVVNQELNMLRDRTKMQELQISDYDKESHLLRNILNEALQQTRNYEHELDQLKEKLQVVSGILKQTEEQKTMILGVLEDKQKQLASSSEKDKEQVKQLESITDFVRGLSKSIADLESRLTDNIDRNISRLKVLVHQLSPLMQLASQHQKKCLWYQNMLEVRCSDLQKAEAEVDLLGDEVEALLGLLGKIYLALDHYSPVLQHYPGVMEILKLIQIELNGENN
ncbi:WPP domain-associated protein-like isoform X1 [Canna indica]|uniref:WPP domain-associated protein-like isoform X1 n=1 Tax=Canna indica TaxID=4628 RepID=A0AAQ3PWH8_9LILI|nr:WPP domain-associated protein-like isoform X1 [Canna indica]